MRKFLYIFSFFSILVAGALFSAPDAGAMPPVQTTNTLSLISPNGAYNVNVSETTSNSGNTWLDIVNAGNQPSNDARCSSTLRTSLNTAYNNNRLYMTVSQRLSSSDSTHEVLVWWFDEDRGNSIHQYAAPYDNYVVMWHNTSGSTPVYGLNMTIDNTGQINWQCALNNSLAGTIVATTNPSLSGINNNIYLYYDTFSTTYPEGYGDNPLLPTEPTDPVSHVALDYSLNFSLTGYGKSFIATYVNKTTNPVASIPDPTQINWAVLDLSTVDNTQPYGYDNVCSNTLLPVNVSFTYDIHCANQFPIGEWQTGHKYVVIANIGHGYSTGQYQIDNIIYDISYKANSISIPWTSPNYNIIPGDNTICDNYNAGDFGLGQNCHTVDYWNACFLETFPFIDLPTCLSNFSAVGNLMTFNLIDFSPNRYVLNADACYTLGTIGDWLNLDNHQVCPAFSPNIRNIVTPFVTFLLGLLMVRFLGRYRGTS